MAEEKDGKPTPKAHWGPRLHALEKAKSKKLTYLGPNQSFPVEAGNPRSYLAAYERARQHHHDDIAAKALAAAKRMRFAWALNHRD